MNQISKLLKDSVFRTVAVSAVAVFMLPTVASALSEGAGAASSTTPASQTPKTSEFCTNLPNEQNSVEQKLNGDISKAEQDWSNKGTDWQNVWNNVDTQVAADRQKADADRSKEFSLLQAKSKNPSEQQAVQTYITAVTSAVTVRRSAYDSARQTFRAAVDAAIAARSSTVTNQFEEFQSAVNLSFTTAQTSCSSDPANGQAYRSALQSSLKSARTTFISDRKADTTIFATVKQLETTRNNAFSAADQTFTSAIQNARQTLIQAFKSTGNSSSVN
jgi:hypothetical protein